MSEVTEAEMPPRMSDEQLAAFHRKIERNKARKRRKAAKKCATQQVRIDTIPVAGLGPNGEYPVFGLLDGKEMSGFPATSLTPTQELLDWKNDIFHKPRTLEEAEKDAIEEKLKYWPWRQQVPRNLVTLAPFLINFLRNSNKRGQPFEMPEAEQESLLFTKLLSNELVRQKLTDLLFINHSTAWKFAATSRQSWRYITHYTANWDFTRGWFGNCETPRDHSLDTEHLVAKTLCGSVPSVIIVSPVRGPLVYPDNIEDLDEVEDVVDDKLYRRQVVYLHKMCTAMSNFADYFRNLQLHRIPFLKTDVLALTIPMMRNLKVLGIYQCPLIHIGETLRLLEIIQVDKIQEKKHQISLDFYPMYHVGPIPFPGNTGHTGSFGVTWDNWNGDTRLAIWQLVSIIIPQAIEARQDFLSKHTMFRQWLDKTPCWRVAETLGVLELRPGDTRSQLEIDEDFAVMVDYPNTGGSKTKFKRMQPNHPEGWQWKLERHPCYICGLNPLGIFFYYKDIKEATDQRLTADQLQLTCLACRLIHWLNNETDHYKREKRQIISSWLCEDDEVSGEQVWNDTNMPKALRDFGERRIWARARWLDRKRIKAMYRRNSPLDKEYDEEQKPFTKAELGRLGLKNRSPTVGSKNAASNQWNSWDSSRTWAHGHGVPW